MTDIVEGYAECAAQMKNKDVQDRNLNILSDRMTEYNKIPGARVGDWIRETSGRMTRATHDWNDAGEDTEIIQHGGSEFGQFYLGDGYISYSGGLDTGIKKNQIRDTGEVKKGKVWFFRNDYATAGNGIDYMVDFRVFEVIS